VDQERAIGPFEKVAIVSKGNELERISNLEIQDLDI